MSEHLDSDLPTRGYVFHTCQPASSEMASIQPKRPPSRKISAVHVRPSAPSDILGWLNSLGQGEVPLLVVEAGPAYRQMVYGWCSAIAAPRWQSTGIRNEVIWSILNQGQPIFTELLTGDTLIVEEPLRSMVDQRFYLVSDLFRVILEARFQVREGAEPHDFIDAIRQWIIGGKLSMRQDQLFEAAGVTRRVQPTEQLDLVFFLIALASQTGITNRLTLSLDQMELASLSGAKDKRTYLKELDEVAFAATRWSKLGSTLGIIVGVEKISLLSPSPKLSKLLSSGIIHRQPV